MKRTALVLVLCLIACAALAAFPDPARPASRSISVATGFSLGHPVMRRVLLPWAEEVRRRTEGRVEMRFFNPGVLVPEREHFNAVRAGELGAGHGLVSAGQGRLLITGIMEMPSEMTNCLAASEAFWRLFSSSPEMRAEFGGIKVLAMHASAPYQLNMAKGGIREARDFKNQKLLTSTGDDSARFLRALGLNPLMTPPRDFALSLSRGMADGCVLPMCALRASKLEENLSSITICNLHMDAYWIGMNMDVYNALPGDAQSALNDLSGQELSLSIARVLNELNNLARAELAKEEITLNELSAGERARWLDQGAPVLRDNWLAQLKRRDINNGQEIWSRAQKIFHESQTKWAGRTSQQISVIN